MKIKFFAVLTSVLLFSTCSAPAAASDIPTLPNAFYGTLTLNGSPAPAGTTVEARGTGVRTGLPGNPIVTAETGHYGGADPLGNRLVVQGDITDGAVISFYVGGVLASETAVWHSGVATELNLNIGTAPVVLPAPAGGGGTAPAPTPTVNPVSTPVPSAVPGVLQLNGKVDDSGKFTAPVSVSSPSGEASLAIDAGTIGLMADRMPLAALSITPVASPPPLPTGSNAIGLMFDLGPNGAVFDKPVTITLKYDPSRLAAGASEAGLVIAWYNMANNSWVELQGTVDTVNKTISASVTHFTVFTVIEPVKKAAFVSPVVEKAPDVAKPAAAPPVPSPSNVPTGPTSLTSTQTINWWLILGILAGIFVVILVAWKLINRLRT